MAKESFLAKLRGRLDSEPPDEGGDADDNGQGRRVRRRKRPLHLAVVALQLILLLYIVFLVISGSGSGGLAALSVSLACVAVGALLGFIFAIPKRTEVALIKAPDSENGEAGAAPAVRATVPESAYRPNTSLEEISDWLTKIIVGLGLVQAQSIGRFVREQGAAIAPELYGEGAAPILGSATLVAISVLTFLTSFLYFRLYLAEEFTRSDVDALRAQSGYEKAKEKGRTQVLGPRTALKAIARSSAVALPSSAGHEAEARVAAASGGDTGSGGARSTLEETIERKLAAMRDNPLDPSDPAKGMFGGKSRVVDPLSRELKGTVRAMRGDPNNFKIDLVLKSEDPKIRGQVVFFYHPTFDVSHERVRVSGGEARIRLYAYGAFTVGALADDGETELELDLSEIEGAPELFLEN
jgi:hypothetical protein